MLTAWRALSATHRRLLIGAFLAPLLFFWPLFVPIPGIQQTIIAGDFLFEYYPQRLFFSRELWQGRLPLWNPHIYAGNPGLYEPQIAAFYPLTWLTALLGGPHGPAWWLLELETVWHLSLAGIFTFLLVRRLLAPRTPGGADGPAVLAALTYMFGGYLTSWPLNQLSVLESSVWLPLMLYLLDRGTVQGTRYYALAAVAWAASFWAGHPQPPLYALYAGGAFLAWRVLVPAHDAPPNPALVTRLRPLAGYVLFAVLALGLAAVQILPTSVLQESSKHSQMPLDIQAHGISVAELGALLIPLHWGNQAVFVGMAPLALALFAVLVPGRRDRWAFVLLALGGLTLALGGATPLYWIARAVVPGMTLIRDQERAVALWSAALAVVVGFGADALLRADAPRRRLAAALCAVLAVLIAAQVPFLARPDARPEAHALYDLRTLWALASAVALCACVWRPALLPRIAVPVLAVLIVGDLYSANARYALSPGGDPAPEPQAVRFIHADPAGPFRVSSESLLPGSGDAGMIYDFEDIVGSSSLEPALYEDFWARVRTDTNEGMILDLLNVKYILTLRDLPTNTGELTLVHEDGDWNLYRRDHTLPRAYVVSQGLVSDDPARAADYLRAPTFDPRTTAVLASAPAANWSCFSATPATPCTGAAPGAVVTLDTHTPTYSAFTVHLTPPGPGVVPDPGVLIFSQRAFPGWQVTVNGVPATPLRANLAFNAVALGGPGVYRVEWRFAPEIVWQGALISLGALLGVLVVVRGGQGARKA